MIQFNVINANYAILCSVCIKCPTYTYGEITLSHLFFFRLYYYFILTEKFDSKNQSLSLTSVNKSPTSAVSFFYLGAFHFSFGSQVSNVCQHSTTNKI